MAATRPLRTVSAMRVPNVSSVGQASDVIGGNPQPVSKSSSDDWSKRLSLQHVYEEIKDEDAKKIRQEVNKVGQSSQSDRSAYFRRDIRCLDAVKLYNQHRHGGDRECSISRFKRFISKDDQWRSMRLPPYNRRHGLDTSDANLYKLTSCGPGRRGLQRSSSLSVLYRSGGPPLVNSRHRRRIKEGNPNESIEMSIKRECSLPTSVEDCPPPIPRRTRRNDTTSVV
ncbi:Hypp988 [Branchiostoma lanceolatum]|uniref:Hypp988 protein n=1 Tax=Branchiostoma lanceolatum TaxID=7740 RepID=A0A8J9ZFG4_BRALA|nr:Hypp988 [Branchiostoma lanceolatum]